MSEKLEEVFDFDKADLLLNQSGNLSEKQIQLVSQHRRIRRFGGRISIICFFVSIVSVTAISLYIIGVQDLRKHPEIALIFAAVFLICSGLFIFFYLLGNFRSDLKSGKISIIEGTAEKAEKKMPRGLGTAYYLKIGNVKFQLDEKAKYRAIQPNVGYHIFYIIHPPTHIILSISEISDFK